MTKHGRGGDAPGKGNPGGARGGNRAGGGLADEKTMRDGRPASRQSHGADPHRGEPAGPEG